MQQKAGEEPGNEAKLVTVACTLPEICENSFRVHIHITYHLLQQKGSRIVYKSGHTKGTIELTSVHFMATSSS